MDLAVSIINLIIEAVAAVMSWLFSILPSSPTLSWVNQKPEMVDIGYITWFIPFPTMLLHLSFLLVAIGFYYIYRFLGRWLKVVRG